MGLLSLPPLAYAGISSVRVRQIQVALTKQGIPVKATGKFDAKTKEALQKYQRQHGWQSVIVPDSRALICLGLGPKSGKLLNPNTAQEFNCGPR